MKKLAYVVVAAFAAFLVMLGLHSPAQAYPDVDVSLTASRTIVNSGDSLTVTAASNVACAWSESWNSEGRTSSGSSFVTTYVAPRVTKITKLLVQATCSYAAPGRSARAAAQSWAKELTITVLPAASGATVADGGANLPGTGGPSRVWVAGGLVLLLAGASAVIIARRRAESEFTYEADPEPLRTMGSLL